MTSKKKTAAQKRQVELPFIPIIIALLRDAQELIRYARPRYCNEPLLEWISDILKDWDDHESVSRLRKKLDLNDRRGRQRTMRGLRIDYGIALAALYWPTSFDVVLEEEVGYKKHERTLQKAVQRCPVDENDYFAGVFDERERREIVRALVHDDAWRAELTSSTERSDTLQMSLKGLAFGQPRPKQAQRFGYSRPKQADSK
jgi:hypothetical protein